MNEAFTAVVSEVGSRAEGKIFSQQRSEKFCAGCSSAILRDAVYVLSAAPGRRQGRTEKGKLEAKKPNVQSRASRTVSRGDFGKHELLRVIALRNIKVREELFLNYNEKLTFQKINTTNLFEESRMKSKESKYIADLEQRCNDVRYLLDLTRMGHEAFVKRQSKTTF